jgi:spermidine synthase
VLADERVTIRIEDVSKTIARAATDGSAYDAILLDLYEGPNAASRGEPSQQPYTVDALKRARAALRPRGLLAVWSEAADAAFEERLRRVGLRCERHHPDRTARRHVVYLAVVSAS